MIIGIDPGKSGGVAWFRDDLATAVRMPTTTGDLWDLLNSLVSNSEPRVAFIEKVGPMPQQGVVSVWTFGRGFGELMMALCAAEISHELVAPSKWQRALQCQSGGNKNITKAAAQRLFPHLKITHAIADALLIAEYGRREIAARWREIHAAPVPVR